MKSFATAFLLIANKASTTKVSAQLSPPPTLNPSKSPVKSDHTYVGIGACKHANDRLWPNVLSEEIYGNFGCGKEDGYDICLAWCRQGIVPEYIGFEKRANFCGSPTGYLTCTCLFSGVPKKIPTYSSPAAQAFREDDNATGPIEGSYTNIPGPFCWSFDLFGSFTHSPTTLTPTTVAQLSPPPTLNPSKSPVKSDHTYVGIGACKHANDRLWPNVLSEEIYGNFGCGKEDGYDICLSWCGQGIVPEYIGFEKRANFCGSPTGYLTCTCLFSGVPKKIPTYSSPVAKVFREEDNATGPIEGSYTNIPGPFCWSFDLFGNITYVPTTLSPTSSSPTALHSDVPSSFPTNVSTSLPTNVPTSMPTNVPTYMSTKVPTSMPTKGPTSLPMNKPTSIPTNIPTSLPMNLPPALPTNLPISLMPTIATLKPVISAPTSLAPTVPAPTSKPVTTHPTGKSTKRSKKSKDDKFIS